MERTNYASINWQVKVDCTVFCYTFLQHACCPKCYKAAASIVILYKW